MASDGTGFMVVWRDGRNSVVLGGGLVLTLDSIYGARLDRAGAVLDPNGIRITSWDTADHPVIAANGCDYLVVWDEDHGRYQSFLGREQQSGSLGSNVGNNWANFIAVLRTCKHEDLNAPIEEGAISTTLVHLANISYRLGRTLHFDAASYSVTGDAAANKMFRRDYRKPFVVLEKV